MLEVCELECQRGERRLFSGIGFFLESGRLLQVSGPNGSGKTSLLRMLCGLLAPVKGEIKWRGSPIRSLGEEYLREVTYLGHLNGIKEDLNSFENLKISLGLAGIGIDHREAQAALAQMGLADRADLPAKALSQGQKRRLALTRLILSKARLWLLDEPLTALDSAAVAIVQGLLDRHLNEGGVAVVATHQELGLKARSVARLRLTS